MAVPLVSIILVNYNNAEDTIDCVRNLEEIEYNNYEIIVVENGSTDGSAEILRNEIRSHSLIISETNDGYASGVNLGIKRALKNEAEYILLLNNDTQVEDDFLSPLVDVVSSHDNVVAASSVIRYLETGEVQYAGGKIFPHFAKFQIDTEVKDENPYETESLLGAVVFISADFLEDIGGLDENYFYGGDDIDLSYQIQNRGYTAMVVPGSLVYHRSRAVAGNSNAFLIYHLIRNRLYFSSKNLDLLRRLTAYGYLFIFQVIRLLPWNRPGIGNKEFIYASFLGVYDHVTRHDLRRPRYFYRVSWAQHNSS